MVEYVTAGTLSSLVKIANEIEPKSGLEVMISPDWREIQGWKTVVKGLPHYKDVVAQVFSIRRGGELKEFSVREIQSVISLITL